MVKKYNRVIRTYFSDFFGQCLAISILFVITATFAFNSANKFIWVVPLIFLFILLLSTPMFILYFRVRKDLKVKSIEKLSIKIKEIKADNRHTFLSRRGAPVGKRKYKIIDENDNEYLISSSNETDDWKLFYMHPSFSVEMDVLKKSRLVLNMKLIDAPDTTNRARYQNQKQNIKAFEKLFCQYFYL